MKYIFAATIIVLCTTTGYLYGKTEAQEKCTANTFTITLPQITQSPGE